MTEYIIDWDTGLVIDTFSKNNLREEIVRCRDCKWLYNHNLYLCMFPDDDGGNTCWVVRPDGFCAWGERKADA